MAIDLSTLNISKEGLDADQIAAVKEKLGISGGALGTLKAGSIKPLTTTVDRRNAIILGVVNSTICEECKKSTYKLTVN